MLAPIAKEACPNDEPYLLFCDNLEEQIAEEFKFAVNLQGGKPWYSVPNATDNWQPVDREYVSPNATDNWQPVDREYVSSIKALVNQEFYNWLDDDDHCDLCSRQQDYCQRETNSHHKMVWKCNVLSRK